MGAGAQINVDFAGKATIRQATSRRLRNNLASLLSGNFAKKGPFRVVVGNLTNGVDESTRIQLVPQADDSRPKNPRGVEAKVWVTGTQCAICTIIGENCSASELQQHFEELTNPKEAPVGHTVHQGDNGHSVHLRQPAAEPAVEATRLVATPTVSPATALPKLAAVSHVEVTTHDTAIDRGDLQAFFEIVIEENQAGISADGRHLFVLNSYISRRAAEVLGVRYGRGVTANFYAVHVSRFGNSVDCVPYEERGWNLDLEVLEEFLADSSFFPKLQRIRSDARNKAATPEVALASKPAPMLDDFAKLKALVTHVAGLQSEVDTSEEALARLQGEFSADAARIEALEEQLAGLKAVQKNRERTIATETATMEEKQHALNEQKSLLVQLREEVGSLFAQFQALFTEK